MLLSRLEAHHQVNDQRLEHELIGFDAHTLVLKTNDAALHLCARFELVCLHVRDEQRVKWLHQVKTVGCEAGLAHLQVPLGNSADAVASLWTVGLALDDFEQLELVSHLDRQLLALKQ